MVEERISFCAAHRRADVCRAMHVLLTPYVSRWPFSSRKKAHLATFLANSLGESEERGWRGCGEGPSWGAERPRCCFFRPSHWCCPGRRALCSIRQQTVRGKAAVESTMISGDRLACHSCPPARRRTVATYDVSQKAVWSFTCKFATLFLFGAWPVPHYVLKRLHGNMIAENTYDSRNIA